MARLPCQWNLHDESNRNGPDVQHLWTQTGEVSESGTGLPHSKTLARISSMPFHPPGFGVRQPYAAFVPAPIPLVFISVY
jgi:hypothetical protein